MEELPKGRHLIAAVLADTHAILLYLTADARISRAATAAMDNATAAVDSIFVSAITMVEIQYLVEKGRLSADDQRSVVAAVDDVQNPARLVLVDRIVVDTLGQVNRDEVPEMRFPTCLTALSLRPLLRSVCRC